MSKLPRRWAFLSLALALMISLGGIRATSAQSSLQVWSVVGGVPSTVQFTGVFMVDPGDAWAVGYQGDSGVVYHLRWLGDRWDAARDATFDRPLFAVAAVSDQNVWAVGGAGLVHKDTSGWHGIASPQPGASLLTIQMFGNGEEGWAGGFLAPTGHNESQPALLHFQNGAWRPEPVSGRGAITSLHFTGRGGWAAGTSGIWHYSDGRWTEEALPEPCPDGGGCVASLSGVRAIDDGEAWAVGLRSGTCAICVPRYYAIHRTGGVWQVALPVTPVVGFPAQPGPPVGSELNAVYFDTPGHGLAVGLQTNGLPLLLSYHDGQWFYEALPETPTGTGLWSVSMADAAHAMAVGNAGTILAYGYGQPSAPPTQNPTARVENPHDPNVTYFDLVGHTLRGLFRTYWQQHGGLAQFGYPLTEEFVEGGYLVQYFERARFELHQENRPPYDVLLGLLGHTISAGRESEPPFQPAPPQGRPGTHYFPETGHTLAAEFLPYWQQHGGLPIYGYPISEAFTEINQADGRPYLVQYFERNRFEYHPELPQPYQVSLGLLGAEVLRERGWLP